MEMTSEALAAQIRAKYLFTLFEGDHSYDPKRNAQKNLMGRTHWADDDTLRFFGCRIVKTAALDNGVIFGVLHSQYGEYERRTRVYRVTFFDLSGTCIADTDIMNAFKTKAAALKEFWRVANELDAVALTLDMLRNENRKAVQRASDTHAVLCSAEVAA